MSSASSSRYAEDTSGHSYPMLMTSVALSRARRKKKSVRMSVDFGESGGGETGAAAGAVAAGAADPEEVQILLPREEEEEGRAGFSNGGGRVPGVSSGAGGGGGNTALLQTQERGPLDAQVRMHTIFSLK